MFILFKISDARSSAWRHLYTAWFEFPHPNEIDSLYIHDGDRKTEWFTIPLQNDNTKMVSDEQGKSLTWELKIGENEVMTISITQVENKALHTVIVIKYSIKIRVKQLFREIKNLILMQHSPYIRNIYGIFEIKRLISFWPRFKVKNVRFWSQSDVNHMFH